MNLYKWVFSLCLRDQIQLVIFWCTQTLLNCFRNQKKEIGTCLQLGNGLTSLQELGYASPGQILVKLLAETNYIGIQILHQFVINNHPLPVKERKGQYHHRDLIVSQLVIFDRFPFLNCVFMNLWFGPRSCCKVEPRASCMTPFFFQLEQHLL